ncbi:hypothetical protein COP1_036098 [Malus domestica]
MAWHPTPAIDKNGHRTSPHDTDAVPTAENFSLAASLSSTLSLGLKNTDGTESMDTIVKTSSKHPSFSPINSILASGGSNGNSTIFQPRLVNLPSLFRTCKLPKTLTRFVHILLLMDFPNESRPFARNYGHTRRSILYWHYLLCSLGKNNTPILYKNTVVEEKML